MVPVSLIIKGINSYQEEQFIDFEKLSQDAIFGIFGAVGSGKSTILEAIAFAIYGETERLNSRENRNYNLMNLKAGELLIDFVCRAGRENTSLYRFVVRGKKSGRSENIKPFGRSRLKKSGEEWIPCDESPEEIIGLSYVNFQRTIIIPQGKFSEFLHLSGSDRTAALMEIFHLDKFNLDGKTANLQKKTEEKLSDIKGRIGQLGEISREELENHEIRLKQTAEQEEELNKKISLLQQQEKLLSQLRSWHQELEKLKAELNNLLLKEDHFKTRADQLRRYRIARERFEDIMKSRNDREKRLESSVQTLKEHEDNIIRLSAALAEQSGTFSTLEEKFLKRDSLLAQAAELKKIAELRQIEEKLNNLGAGLKTGESYLLQLEQQQGPCSERIKTVQEQVSLVEAALPDPIQLSLMQSWFTEKKGLEQSIADLETELLSCASEVELINGKKRSILQQKEISGILTLDEEPEFEFLEQALETKKEYYQEAMQLAEKEWQRSQLEKSLAHYALELKPGDPCLVCGSLEHPALDTKKDSIHEDALDGKKENLRNNLEALSEAISQVKIQYAAYQQQGRNYGKLRQQQEEKKLKLHQHLQNWRWKPPYQRSNEKSLTDAQTLHTELTEKLGSQRAQLEEDQKLLTAIAAQKEKAIKRLSDIREEISAASARKSALREGISNIRPEHYEGKDSQQIKEEIISLEAEYTRLEGAYRQAKEAILKFQSNLANLQGSVVEGKKNITALEEDLALLQKTLEGRLAESPFSEIEEIKTLLASGLDIAGEEEQIKTYQNALHIARERFTEYIVRVQDQPYEEEVHQELGREIETQTTILSGLKETAGSLKTLITRLKEDLATKEKLGAEAEVLEKRFENLRTLRELFRARGFVDYASSVYLQGLCKAANARFQKLSRQQLRLELNEDNQFEVRDFLNDGKTRHIKTLSGGQTFLAALSLALALADNIQQLAHSPQNFFFLDEGFGSLDKESLQEVMETLKVLRRENRIVGVISHVEELQQEIDVFLKVQLNEDKGSFIGYSWQM
jgi:exonuclease SbcC